MNWQGDKQLVRGSTDGINLAIGEPFVLREAMKQYYPKHYPPDLSYPDTKPSDDLREQLEKLHPRKNIVIALGAKHALHAAVYALKQKDKKINNLITPAPYWPTYPTIAALHGLRFNKPTWFGHDLRVVTSPNNPDGSICTDYWDDDIDIWDAAYAHRAYGFSQESWSIQRAKISVWSAGKMLGAPGVRVGWLVTNDPVLAEHAKRYVEATTSGVPTTSQYHVAATLRNTENVREEIFIKVNQTLRENWTKANRMYGTQQLPQGVIGMFRWFKVPNPEAFKQTLERTKILLVNGTAFGDTADKYRISTAQSGEVYDQAIGAFNQAYDWRK